MASLRLVVDAPHMQLVDAGELLDDERGHGGVVLGDGRVDDVSGARAVGEPGGGRHGEEDEALLAVGDAGLDERGQSVDDALRFLLRGDGAVGLAALSELRVGVVFTRLLHDLVGARADGGFGFVEDAVHIEANDGLHLKVTSLLVLIFMPPITVHMPSLAASSAIDTNVTAGPGEHIRGRNYMRRPGLMRGFLKVLPASPSEPKLVPTAETVRKTNTRPLGDSCLGFKLGWQKELRETP